MKEPVPIYGTPLALGIVERVARLYRDQQRPGCHHRRERGEGGRRPFP